MKVLNLYSGLGGNRKLWAGVDVTAVESHPGIAEHYAGDFPGDTVVVGDAHQYLLEHYAEFDFIWSSPPCQSHSQMAIATRHDYCYPDMSLWQEIILLRTMARCHWVVENVDPYYPPLIPAQVISRHRFWSSWHIPKFPSSRPGEVFYQKKEDIRECYKQAYGLELRQNFYIGNSHDPMQALRNCVNPELGLHILKSIPRDMFGDSIGTSEAV